MEKTHQTTEGIIASIEAAFYGMNQRQEKETIVRKFSDIQEIVLPKETIHTSTVAVKLLQKNERNHIVLDCENHKPINIIFTGTCREKVVKALEDNNILPTAEEFLEARLLIDNSPATAPSDYKRHLEITK